jgi:hypothetical protein
LYSNPNHLLRLAYAASPRPSPCKVAEGSGTRCRGPAPVARISRSIMESHGGRLWAVGVSGRGATFRFTVPTTVSAQAQATMSVADV